jgi:toxin ParE1/3/4
MSTRRWAFHPDVTLELRAAAEGYERRGAGLGEDFVAVFERHLEAAAASTHPGTPVPYVRRADVRWLLLTPRFPYGIVLLVDESSAVIALAHLRRKPGYWRKRLRQRFSVRRA